MSSDWLDKFKKRQLTFDVANSPSKGGIKLLQVPRVIIHPREFARLQAFIDLYDKEIAGVGSVLERANGDLYIEEILLVEQMDNTGVHVDISDGVLKYVTELVDVLDQPDRVERLRCRWHSHVNMEAIFSSVDEEAAEGFGGDYLIDIVGNKRGQFDVRLYFRKPVPIVIGNLPLLLDYEVPGDVRAECRAEIKECVKTSLVSRVGRVFGFGKDPDQGTSFQPYQTVPPLPVSPSGAKVVPPTKDFGKGTTAPLAVPPPLPPRPPIDKSKERVIEQPLDKNGLVGKDTTET